MSAKPRTAEMPNHPNNGTNDSNLLQPVNQPRPPRARTNGTATARATATAFGNIVGRLLGGEASSFSRSLPTVFQSSVHVPARRAIREIRVIRFIRQFRSTWPSRDATSATESGETSNKAPQPQHTERPVNTAIATKETRLHSGGRSSTGSERVLTYRRCSDAMTKRMPAMLATNCSSAIGRASARARVQ